MPKNIPSENSIKFNSFLNPIQMLTCRDIYWHIINLEGHIPTCIQKWHNNYLEFNNAKGKLWINIFRMPFKIVIHTKLFNIEYYTEFYLVTHG